MSDRKELIDRLCLLLEEIRPSLATDAELRMLNAVLEQLPRYESQPSLRLV